jgi:hypothetical protein
LSYPESEDVKLSGCGMPLPCYRLLPSAVKSHAFFLDRINIQSRLRQF